MLLKVLEDLVQEMGGDTDLDVNCECAFDGNQLTDEIKVVLYRMAQERMTNIIRHAEAKHARLKLKLIDNGVYISIVSCASECSV